MDRDSSFGGEYSMGSPRDRERLFAERRASEDTAVIRCDPCLTEMNSVIAEKFCEDCNQYLCDTCIRYHKKFASTARHILVDKSLGSTKPPALDVIFNIDHPIEKRTPEAGMQRPADISKHAHKYENTALAHIGDVNVKTPRDRHDCNITGIELLTADFLVLADNNNNAIKILDTKHREVIAEYTLSSAPWDVAVVEEGSFEPEQLAVTLPKERIIQFLTLTHGKLIEGRRLKVDGDCRGIAYSHNRLAVTCDAPAPCKIEILDMDGRIINTLSKNEQGRNIFQCPQNIAATYDGAYLFVTDRITCDVTKITFDGKVVGVYDNSELCSPEGIVVTRDGTVIVCNYKNHMLHLVSDECEKLKILKPLSDHVMCPTAVCFCEERNKLYVSRYWIGAHPLYVNHINILDFEFLPKSYK